MLAPWRSPLARALHRNRAQPQSRYFQLATVTTDGKAANRTVVFRGFLEPNRLQVFTDARSAKLTQLTAGCEICWYFAKTREQFRIQGAIAAVTAAELSDLQEARQQLWQHLSPAARQQLYWPQPGAVWEEPAIAPTVGDQDYPPENFVLLVISPIAVDHLQLAPDPQERWSYWLTETDWQRQRINP
ncbi:Npun_F5749 family FMN-dependent PPOX-type flavoprotein [Synechococcus elongatus]|uniref:Npun_F5749 family FMN-dependent PPOX-type flavoprotein n=1 Tax=Synechococcus elongatus TaxID=32046 RepID=UPI0030CFBFFF